VMIIQFSVGIHRHEFEILTINGGLRGGCCYCPCEKIHDDRFSSRNLRRTDIQ
jgi:hypothetical protein